MLKTTFFKCNVGIAFIFGLFTNTALSQSFDLGLFSGKSTYLGELQTEYYNSDESKLAYGGFVRTKFNNIFGVRMQYLQTTLSGNDKNSVDPTYYNRNLNFSTDLSEFGFLVELTIVNFGKHRSNTRARSYLFGGISGIYFNPTTNHKGKQVALQPLGTEGQMLNPGSKPYSRWDIVYPFGWGFEFNINQIFSLGVELKLRKTQTDYLDDISGQYPDIQQLRNQNPTAADLSFRTPELTESYAHNPFGEQRGDNKKHDSYLFVGFTGAVKLFEKKSNKPIKHGVFFDDPVR